MGPVCCVVSNMLAECQMSSFLQLNSVKKNVFLKTFEPINRQRSNRILTLYQACLTVWSEFHAVGGAKLHKVKV